MNAVAHSNRSWGRASGFFNGQRSLAVLAALVLVGAATASAQVRFYTDRTTWEADLVTATLTQHPFPFTPANLDKSNELAAPPVGGDILPPTLTFPGSSTGLPFDFVTRVLEPGSTGSYYNLSYYGDNSFHIGAMALPEKEDDDWDFTFTGGPVYAIGGLVGDNGVITGETFQAFNTIGGLLGSTSNVPQNLPALPDPAGFGFIGVISDVPLGRVFFDEGATDADNIGIKDFAFATPEPGTGLLIVAGVVVLMRRGRASTSA